MKIELLTNLRFSSFYFQARSIIGRAESTVHSWLQLYRQGGLEKLLEEHPKTGRPKKRVGDAGVSPAYPTT